MNPDQLENQIEEIERGLMRDDPEFGEQFAQLGAVDRRHDATVFTLLTASAVFLMIGLATTAFVAWLVGVASFIAAFTVDTRHERELRATYRRNELGHGHRRRTHAS